MFLFFTCPKLHRLLYPLYQRYFRLRLFQPFQIFYYWPFLIAIVHRRERVEGDDGMQKTFVRSVKTRLFFFRVGR